VRRLSREIVSAPHNLQFLKSGIVPFVDRGQRQGRQNAFLNFMEASPALCLDGHTTSFRGRPELPSLAAHHNPLIVERDPTRCYVANT